MRSVPRTDVTLEEVAPDLAAAHARFMAVAYPGAVDLVTRELLRILSGRLSHCSVCRNLRLQAAIDRGFEESMVDHLEDPANSNLPERQQIVLRLANAFLTAPESFTPGTGPCWSITTPPSRSRSSSSISSGSGPGPSWWWRSAASPRSTNWPISEPAREASSPERSGAARSGAAPPCWLSAVCTSRVVWPCGALLEVRRGVVARRPSAPHRSSARPRSPTGGPS